MVNTKVRKSLTFFEKQANWAYQEMRGLLGQPNNKDLENMATRERVEAAIRLKSQYYRLNIEGASGKKAAGKNDAQKKLLEKSRIVYFIHDYICKATKLGDPQVRDAFRNILVDYYEDPLARAHTALLIEGMNDFYVADAGTSLSQLNNTLVRRVLRHATRKSRPILIVGETGTGKEKIADVLHQLSDRRTKPICKLNCAAIPDSLMESELFGYVKGAFTGAVKDKKGHLEANEGGIIFLDELGKLSFALQSKLLRAIEDQNILPVGGRVPVKIDVRFIAAVQPFDLDNDAVLPDLLYRLGHPDNINLQSLHEIMASSSHSGIAILQQVLSNVIHKFDRTGLPDHIRFSDEALSVLKELRYEGNFRELENILNGALDLFETVRDRDQRTDSTIQIEDLEPFLQYSMKTETKDIDLDSVRLIDIFDITKKESLKILKQKKEDLARRNISIRKQLMKELGTAYSEDKYKAFNNKLNNWLRQNTSNTTLKLST